MFHILVSLLLLLQFQHYCKQHGAHLVSVESRAEDLFLQDFIARLKGKRNTAFSQ